MAMLRIVKIGEADYPVSVNLTIFIIANGKLQWSGWWGWRRMFFLTLSYILYTSQTAWDCVYGLGWVVHVYVEELFKVTL